MFDAGGGLTAGAYARWNAVASRLAGKRVEHCQVCSSEVRHRALLRWMMDAVGACLDPRYCLVFAPGRSTTYSRYGHRCDAI